MGAFKGKIDKMNIYNGDFLNINYEKENSCFVQFWKSSPDTFDVLKREFQNYIFLYKKYRPENTIWNQKNFQFFLSTEMHLWIEENVNIPCVENGLKKVAFVVGKDVLTHLSVMDYFEKENSVITPVHFATEIEARNWLFNSPPYPASNTKITILFEGVDQEGNSIIKIKKPSQDIANTIRSFSNLIEENNFIKLNISKYSKLTKREKQVLITFSKGLRQKEAADELFISIGTLRTHWKNIKGKLQIKSLADVIQYVNAFNMR